MPASIKNIIAGIDPSKKQWPADRNCRALLFAGMLGSVLALMLALPLTLCQSSLASLLGDLSGPRHASPRIVLWSWQHNDDLRGLDPRKIGVAYLMGRFFLDGDKISMERNLARLKLPSGIYREAALRLEMRPDTVPSDALAEDLSSRMVALALSGAQRIQALQIDFDARQNERNFYVLLLGKVRRKLPPSVKLSITALASWCLGDDWLSAAHLPVDEVVPMLFSMGPQRSAVLDFLDAKSSLSPHMYGDRLAPGFSINEPDLFARLGLRLDSYRRIYIFSSAGWNQKTLIKIQANLTDKIFEEHR